MTDGQKKLVTDCAKGVGFLGGGVAAVAITVPALQIYDDNKTLRNLCFIGTWGISCIVARKVASWAGDFAADCIDLVEASIDCIKEL